MILNNCRLLAPLADGLAADCGSVEIADGRIVRVSAAPSDDPAAFDCAGGTLIPGLIDLHTHVTILSGVGVGKEEDPQAVLLDAMAACGRYLDYGFTTIRDCGSIHRAAHYLRDAVARGLVTGPRIFSAGKEVTSSANAPKTQANCAGINFADGVDAMRRAVREEVAQGADFIKLYASGSAYLPTGVPQHPIMTPKEIAAAVGAAREGGLTTAAHCHADSAIRACIEAGVHTIEHATYISDDTIALALQSDDCYLVPTFSAMYVSQTEPAARAFWTARLQPMLDHCAKAMAQAYRQGAVLGFGTDSAALSPQYENGVEFTMRHTLCHMDAVDILVQATVNNARILGKADEIGRIKAGLVADLVLLDGSPEEDFSVMTRPPRHVWQAGRLVR